MPNAAPPALQFGPRMQGMPMQPPAPTMQPQQGQQGGMPEIMALLAAMKGGQSGVPGSQLSQAVAGDVGKIQGMPEWVGGIFNNLKAGGPGGGMTNPVNGVLQDSLGAAGLGGGQQMPQPMPQQPAPFDPAVVQPVQQEMLPPGLMQQLMPFGWGNYF